MSLTDKQIYDLNNMNVSAQKAQLGNILSTGGQADWNQSDETAPDYIKNRPFYDETVTIEWDGNTEGKTVVPFGNNVYLVRVSDMIPTWKNLIGEVKITSSTGESAILPEVSIIVEEGVIYAPNYIFAVCKKEKASVGNGVRLPKTGLYFLYRNNGYISSITFDSSKQIDMKFLPETRAIFMEGSDRNITCNTPYNVLDSLLSKGVLVSGVFYSWSKHFCSQILCFLRGEVICFKCYTSIDTISEFTYSRSGVTKVSSVEEGSLTIESSTPGSSKRFVITVDDSGTISARERVE